MSETPVEPFALLHTIAKQGFTDALEICCLIQTMERQNQGRVVTTSWIEVREALALSSAMAPDAVTHLLVGFKR